MDIVLPRSRRIHYKEFEKVEYYQDLTRERMWGVKNVDLVPVVVGALGIVTKKHEKMDRKIEG